ncbi:CinA family nicotinamide mononucleotide deamidase-related protein [Flavobacterium piscinae]|uniref:CinA-like protein n=1 Tax=Flavobacterium piscinae TaxID=2506424 RepID=A0A4V1N418_9FLAO|nr:CinA family nicotinamide mononucleotide deamidase-related protein [Flavobacterium piscinae]RXR30616.1 CinA family nicotinamide mononucleotide deamidase-related protein [Flavobacterium piscinae]
MKATIITIGDEILIGQITDTNSGFIAKALNKIGVEVHEMISISDDKNHILETFAKVQNHVDFVIITGGLGPTKDDITKITFCEYFEDILQRNQAVENHIVELFTKMNFVVSQVNRDQAMVPSKCIVLPNNFGTAPGMWMQKENTVFVSLPGVPYEMKAIVTDELIPKIVNEYKRPYILHKTILTYGQGESIVAERIEEWENNLPTFVKLAYLPSPGRVRLRLSARGLDEQFLQTTINELVAQLQEIISDIIVGFEEDESIEFVLGKLLSQKKFTLATAESCTGGKISEVITSVAGSSVYFRGGVVTYATDTKVSLLKVNQSIIDTYSVVSKEVAEEMALGAQKLLQTDFAISTTGNAGPSKGDADVKVGTVCFAIATPKGVFSEEFNFGQPRQKVIDRAVNKGLELLLKEILKNY